MTDFVFLCGAIGVIFKCRNCVRVTLVFLTRLDSVAQYSGWVAGPNRMRGIHGSYLNLQCSVIMVYKVSFKNTINTPNPSIL